MNICHPVPPVTQTIIFIYQEYTHTYIISLERNIFFGAEHLFKALLVPLIMIFVTNCSQHMRTN